MVNNSKAISVAKEISGSYRSVFYTGYVTQCCTCTFPF